MMERRRGGRRRVSIAIIIALHPNSLSNINRVDSPVCIRLQEGNE